MTFGKRGPNCGLNLTFQSSNHSYVPKAKCITIATSPLYQCFTYTHPYPNVYISTILSNVLECSSSNAYIKVSNVAKHSSLGGKQATLGHVASESIYLKRKTNLKNMDTRYYNSSLCSSLKSYLLYVMRVCVYLILGTSQFHSQEFKHEVL